MKSISLCPSIAVVYSVKSDNDISLLFDVQIQAYTLLFQKTYSYGNSYSDAPAFDHNMIKTYASETDLVVITPEDSIDNEGKEGSVTRDTSMPPVVSWRHRKAWHDLAISFFSTRGSSNTDKSDTDKSNDETQDDEFHIIRNMGKSDGVILQGPAGSGKSALLERLTQAIKSVGSEAVSMAYTGKAVKVLMNKGMDAMTIHSFLHS